MVELYLGPHFIQRRIFTCNYKPSSTKYPNNAEFSSQVDILLGCSFILKLRGIFKKNPFPKTSC